MVWNKLLADSIGVYITIVTTVRSAMVNESGDVVEIPLILEGVLVDFDDEMLAVQPKDVVGLAIVFKDKIATIEIMDASDEVMSDPTKPERQDMN